MMSDIKGKMKGNSVNFENHYFAVRDNFFESQKLCWTRYLFLMNKLFFNFRMKFNRINFCDIFSELQRNKSVRNRVKSGMKQSTQSE